MKKASLFLGSLILAIGCSHQMTTAPSADTTAAMNDLARSYVHLVLALGEHDADYVDAYYGPPEWREAVKNEKASLADIRRRGDELVAKLHTIPGGQGIDALRHTYLQKQMHALLTRVDMLGGKKLTFDEESRALYDAVAPHHDEAYFQRLLDELDRELKGSEPLTQRIEKFRAGYVIPTEKLDAVFRAAVDGCRAKTLARMAMPEGETFDIEYVTNKSWSGYNWYKGNYHSLIQVNTDLPIYIDRAIDLACHEGYPGHHAYNVMLEKNLVRDRGWVEFSVYPLFSPQSLIAEGSANYGIDVAFPGAERTKFERAVLYPLAGIDPATAERYARVQELTGRLSYAGNEAARRYLDGKVTREGAIEWLTRYALMSPERAAQRVKFMDTYRSYVINYNLGRDLVAKYVEKKGGTDDRWKIFADLLSTPRVPSTLK
jgi:hypothetical protein